MSLLVYSQPEMVDVTDAEADDGGGDDVDQSRCHERMVEQVFTNDCRARFIEVDGSYIRRIIRDEEITIDRRHHTEENPRFDMQGVGQWQHAHHNSALGVDEYGDGEEGEGDGPRIFRDDAREHGLHLRLVVVEIRVTHPGDTIDGDDGNHTVLPYLAADSVFRLRLTEDDHEGGGSDHDDLNDDVHRQSLGFAVLHKLRQNLDTRHFQQ